MGEQQGIRARVYRTGYQQPMTNSPRVAVSDAGTDTYEQDGYVYRAIATNRDSLSDSEVIHWYNQRGEHSENRIKELKCDFAGGRLPCGQFCANELNFALCALGYNVFASAPSDADCRVPQSCADGSIAVDRLGGQAGSSWSSVDPQAVAGHHAALSEARSHLRRFALAP